jgi:hypothetical protein
MSVLARLDAVVLYSWSNVAYGSFAAEPVKRDGAVCPLLIR